MGIIRQGILGGFRNKTGSVVGAYWRDLNVIRALPRVSNKPATQAQINQRFKFGLVTGFLSGLSDQIDAGFKKGAGSVSAMNAAVAYHLKTAITGVAPNFTLDYTKLKFSTGKLSLPASVGVDVTAPARLDFNWTLDGANAKYKDATDMVNVLVYNPTKNQFVSLMNAAPRSALGFNLPVPPDFTGDTVHTYLSFTSTLKKGLSSNSIHIAAIPIA